MGKTIPAILLILFASCGGGTQDADSPHPGAKVIEKKRLRVAMGNSLSQLDPFLQFTAANDWMLRDNVWESLLRWENGEAIPRLATSWTTQDDRIWLFEVRSEVMFHDGSVLTAADVVSSLKRARYHPKTHISALLSQVEQISTRDSGTVELTLKIPFPALLRNLASVPIVSQAVSEGELDPLVATGPYRVISHDAGRRLLLERFSDYWGDLPSISHAEFIFGKEPKRRVEMLLSGEVEIAFQIPPASIQTIEARDDLWVESSQGLSLRVLVLNIKVPPFDDPRVREAINFGVDREALERGYYESHARSTGQIALPRMNGYLASLETPARNINRAHDLVKEVVGTGSLPLQLYSANAEVSQLLAEQLEEVGFLVEVVLLPWDELYRRLQRREVPFCYLGWRIGAADSGLIYQSRFHSFQANGPLGKTNYVDYSNPEVDRLLVESVATLDSQRQRELLEQVSRIIYEDKPIIPLVNPLYLIGVRREVGWIPSPDPALELSKISLGGKSAF